MWGSYSDNGNPMTENNYRVDSRIPIEDLFVLQKKGIHLVCGVCDAEIVLNPTTVHCSKSVDHLYHHELHVDDWNAFQDFIANIKQERSKKSRCQC